MPPSVDQVATTERVELSPKAQELQKILIRRKLEAFWSEQQPEVDISSSDSEEVFRTKLADLKDDSSSPTFGYQIRGEVHKLLQFDYLEDNALYVFIKSGKQLIFAQIVDYYSTLDLKKGDQITIKCRNYYKSEYNETFGFCLTPEDLLKTWTDYNVLANIEYIKKGLAPQDFADIVATVLQAQEKGDTHLQCLIHSGKGSDCNIGDSLNVGEILNNNELVAVSRGFELFPKQIKLALPLFKDNAFNEKVTALAKFLVYTDASGMVEDDINGKKNPEDSPQFRAVLGIPHVVDAKTAYKTYNDNEIDGDKRYKGKRLIVNGSIDSISVDPVGKPYVVLDGGGMLKGVQLKIDKSIDVERLANLRKNQSLSMVCYGDGLTITTPVFKDCTFLDDFLRVTSNKVVDDAIKTALESPEHLSSPIDLFLAFALVGSVDVKDGPRCLANPFFSDCINNYVSVGKIDNVKAASLVGAMTASGVGSKWREISNTN